MVPRLQIGRVRQADEGQRDRRADRVEHGVDEVGRDQADLVRHDLEGDDPPAALAGLAGGGDEVTAADRQRLGPDHPRAPGPAQPGEHQDGRGLPGARQVAEQDDQQRQRGDHQEHVAEQRQQVVPDAAEVARRHADEHRQDGGDHADQEAELQRQPDAGQQLRQYVLAGLGGAEQVRGIRRVQRQGQAWVLVARVIRRDERPDDGGEHEQPEQDRACLGLQRQAPPPAKLASRRSRQRRGSSVTFIGRAVLIRLPLSSGRADRPRR